MSNEFGYFIVELDPSIEEKTKIRKMLDALKVNPRGVKICETCEWYSPKIFGEYTPRDGPDQGKIVANENASSGKCTLHKKWVNWIDSCGEWKFNEYYFFEEGEASE